MNNAMPHASTEKWCKKQTILGSAFVQQPRQSGIQWSAKKFYYLYRGSTPGPKQMKNGSVRIILDF